MHPLHKEILELIKRSAGSPTKHTFLDSYVGNSHPRYPINAPTLRRIARDWLSLQRELNSIDFVNTLNSLIAGSSSTEKCMVGILLDYSRKEQRNFSPLVFRSWLDQVEGWAEVDSICTGSYHITAIPGEWKTWKKLLEEFSKSDNINKRRASLVLFCSCLRKTKDDTIVQRVFKNVDRLRAERSILITKAISWVLRCAAIHHKNLVKKYLALNKDMLPKIAVRETMTLLKTGRKTALKKPSL